MKQCEDRGYNFGSVKLRESLTSIIFKGQPSRKLHWIRKRVHEVYHEIDPFVDN
jgi:hypothetical protein